MEKIDFINNQQPALNATNLNKIQDNVEDAIQEVQDDADDLNTNKLDKTSVKTTYTESATDTYSCNYVNGLETYSTSETNTGKKWIDGKTIYRKVVTGNLSSGSIAHGLTNVTFVNSYGHFVSGSGAFMPLPCLRVSYPEYNCGYYVNATNIAFEKGNSASGTAYITLEYTKN